MADDNDSKEIVGILKQRIEDACAQLQAEIYKAWFEEWTGAKMGSESYPRRELDGRD